MKKFFNVLFFIGMLVCSTNGFASCNLDQYVWDCIYEDKEVRMFIDSRNIFPDVDKTVEFRTCQYFAKCKIHEIEDYHYGHFFIDYKKKMITCDYIVAKNSKGKVIEEENPIGHIKITPKTLSEDIAKYIKTKIKKNEIKKQVEK